MLTRAVGLLLLAIWTESGSIRFPCRSSKFTQCFRNRLFRSRSSGFLSSDESLPTLGEAIYEAGDLVFLDPDPWGLMEPWNPKFWLLYEVFLALDNERLLQIQVEETDDKWRWVVPEIVMREDLVLEKKCSVEKPDEALKPIGLAKTLILAWRLRGVTLPYNLRSCNSRHYIDYLTYGRKIGQRGIWSCWKIYDRCPLYTVITPETNVGASDFLLTDNRRKKRKYSLESDNNDVLAYHSSSSSDSSRTKHSNRN